MLAPAAVFYSPLLIPFEMCTPAFQPLLLLRTGSWRGARSEGTPAQKEILMVEFELKAAVAYAEGSGSVHILIPYSCIHVTQKQPLRFERLKELVGIQNLQMI